MCPLCYWILNTALVCRTLGRHPSSRTLPNLLLLYNVIGVACQKGYEEVELRQFTGEMMQFGMNAHRTYSLIDFILLCIEQSGAQLDDSLVLCTRQSRNYTLNFVRIISHFVHCERLQRFLIVVFHTSQYSVLLQIVSTVSVLRASYTKCIRNITKWSRLWQFVRIVGTFMDWTSFFATINYIYYHSERDRHLKVFFPSSNGSFVWCDYYLPSNQPVFSTCPANQTLRFLPTIPSPRMWASTEKKRLF